MGETATRSLLALAVLALLIMTALFIISRISHTREELKQKKLVGLHVNLEYVLTVLFSLSIRHNEGGECTPITAQPNGYRTERGQFTLMIGKTVIATLTLNLNEETIDLAPKNDFIAAEIKKSMRNEGISSAALRFVA